MIENTISVFIAISFLVTATGYIALLLFREAKRAKMTAILKVYEIGKRDLYLFSFLIQ